MTDTGRESLGFVLFASAVTAIGGFLFGYDTAVINGANTFLQQHFGLHAETDAFLIGMATSAAIIGCIPGAMSAGFVSDRFGRRTVLFFCAILYAISGVLLCITIIGIPFGIQSFKFVPLALFPFGKEIVRSKDLRDEIGAARAHA